MINIKHALLYLVFPLILSQVSCQLSPDFGKFAVNDKEDNTGGIVPLWGLGTETSEFSPRFSHETFEFKNSLWVVGGRIANIFLDDVWVSSDGISWSCVTDGLPIVEKFQKCLVMNNTIWAIASNELWSSSDGTNWNLVNSNLPFVADSSNRIRKNFSTVVFHGSLWVIAGYLDNDRFGADVWMNDAWYSSDGTNWHLANPWGVGTRRMGSAAVVFHDAIWLIGGDFDYGSFARFENKIACSRDGTNWHNFTPVNLTQRYLAEAVVHNNKLWILGGTSCGPVQAEDAMYSHDGTNWTIYDDNPPFVGLYQFRSVVFKNRIWIQSGTPLFTVTGTKKIWYKN